MKRIVCFGDSNTWGYIPGSDRERFPAHVRWPGVLQTELGPDFVVIEEAQNGRTTMWDDPSESVDKNGIRNLPIVLESQCPIDLMIVMLGTNDLKMHLNLSAHSIAHGMGALVDRILDCDVGPERASPQVLVISPAPVSDEPCPFGHLFDHAAERSQELAAAYQEVANDRGVAFLNAGEFAQCPSPDSIHIDAEGCKRLGLAVAQKLREIFAEGP